MHRYTSWNDTEMAATPEGAEAAAFLRRRQLDSLVRRFSDFEAERSSWSPEWQDAAGMSDHVVRLTPRSLAELRDRITALVEEYADRDAADPDAEQVFFYQAGYPRTSPAESPEEPGRESRP